MLSINSTRTRLATTAAIATVSAMAVAAPQAPAATARPRIQSVQAQILVGGGLDPLPTVTVSTANGTSSSLTVSWLGHRTAATASRGRSATTWSATTPGVRKDQRVRVRIVARGPGGTTTTTRTVRFSWRNVWR